MKKTICFITGGRAEYDLLKPIMLKFKETDKFDFKLVATGAHLSHEFGLTYKNILKDGFNIDKKVDILLSLDSETSISKSLGLGVISFSSVFEDLKPDLIVVLGDRYEILSACLAAMCLKIKIAHIHGGELTEGAIDDAIRHSITKMSHLHFTSTEKYRQRVIQLGEQPEFVFNVGALGVENIKNIKFLEKEDLEEKLNFSFNGKVGIVTFHPSTLDTQSPKSQFKNILNVLKNFKDLKLIFTKANADSGGRSINLMIDTYVNENENCIAFESMGQLNYFSALKYSNIVIGNSSSGIIEVPSFNIPTVNIGNRQKGRESSISVINCGNSEEEISNAILKGLDENFNNCVQNIYEKPNTCNKIVFEIENFLNKNISAKKVFYDILK